MPFEINEVQPTQYSVAVTVEPGVVRQKRNKIFHEVKEHAQLPGFRPGKIPAKIIEKHFHDAIEEKLKDDLIWENVSQFFRETKLHIIGQPRLKEPSFNLDESFSFTIDLDIIPEFELAEYKNLELEKSKTVVSEQEVESQLL